jgi:hypothetical protein
MVASRAAQAAGAGSQTRAARLVLNFYSVPFDASTWEVVKDVCGEFVNISIEIGKNIALQVNM